MEHARVARHVDEARAPGRLGVREGWRVARRLRRRGHAPLQRIVRYRLVGRAGDRVPREGEPRRHRREARQGAHAETVRQLRVDRRRRVARVPGAPVLAVPAAHWPAAPRLPGLRRAGRRVRRGVGRRRLLGEGDGVLRRRLGRDRARRPPQEGLPLSRRRTRPPDLPRPRRRFRLERGGLLDESRDRRRAGFVRVACERGARNPGGPRGEGRARRGRLQPRGRAGARARVDREHRHPHRPPRVADGRTAPGRRPSRERRRARRHRRPLRTRHEILRRRVRGRRALLFHGAALPEGGGRRPGSLFGSREGAAVPQPPEGAVRARAEAGRDRLRHRRALLPRLAARGGVAARVERVPRAQARAGLVRRGESRGGGLADQVARGERHPHALRGLVLAPGPPAPRPLGEGVLQGQVPPPPEVGDDVGEPQPAGQPLRGGPARRDEVLDRELLAARSCSRSRARWRARPATRVSTSSR